MTDNAPVLLDIDQHIATITLNRPELRNPISDPDMIDALVDIVNQLNHNLDVRVAILTGAGKAFSSGGNLKKMGRYGGLNDSLPAQTRRNYKNGIQHIPLAFEALEVPVIAAVNGPAIGAGCDLTCMCDIRIASENAVFAESFVKVGLIPGDGGAWLLPRVVGYSKAAEMAFTGEALTSQEALECGLVSDLVAAEELLPKARLLAEKIAANPPHAVRMTKRLMKQAQTQSLASILELSAAMQASAHATQDHNEAVDALLEKRKPGFTGK